MKRGGRIKCILHSILWNDSLHLTHSNYRQIDRDFKIFFKNTVKIGKWCKWWNAITSYITPTQLQDWTGTTASSIINITAIVYNWLIIYAWLYHSLNKSTILLLFRLVSMGKHLKKSCLVINVNHYMSLSCTGMKTALINNVGLRLTIPRCKVCSFLC